MLLILQAVFSTSNDVIELHLIFQYMSVPVKIFCNSVFVYPLIDFSFVAAQL